MDHVLLFKLPAPTGNVNPAVDGIYPTTTHAGAIILRINF
jgi:hypothetical protein